MIKHGNLYFSFHKLFDHCIFSEYIGYIKSTEGPKLTSNGKTWFKGSLGFNGGLTVKFIVWSESCIQKHQPTLIRNHIIHFENALANALNPLYNKDSPVAFEFVFTPSTSIYDLGIYTGEIRSISEPNYELCDLTNLLVGDHDNVELKNIFLKTSIASQVYGTSVTQFCSITDGTQKMDIKFSFSIEADKFKKGQPLLVRGKLFDKCKFLLLLLGTSLFIWFLF